MSEQGDGSYHINMSSLRLIVALIAMMVRIYGLIWDTK